MKVALERVAALLRRKAQEIERRVRTAEQESAKEALAIAKGYSSGPYSARQLRMLGHPYAKRAPRPPMRPSIINVGSGKTRGRFRASWQVKPTRDGWRVVNVSPEAKFLTAKGTDRMIGRPVVRAVAQAIRQKRERRLRAAVKQGLEAR